MSHSSGSKGKYALLAAAFGALGVVYGDIGTSPLYAINEVFFGKHYFEQSHEHIVGLISTVLWALILVVALKYVTFVLRADNEGEGGVFSLLALIRTKKAKITMLYGTVLLFAAGLLFGDGIITPAISVLSAIEGLKVATPAFDSYVIPITIGILTGLFMVQKKGTATIGKFFGPIILTWFASIAILGLRQIIATPNILEAFNPYWALQFLLHTHAIEILHTLGAVMLVITGGEALYADLGHFGKKPIRLSWFSIVMPCLMLNYLGQGAYLLSEQAVTNNNIFFSMVPTQLIYPMVILAAMATVIASQALISGVFSLSSQGVALGFLPRLRITHTHEEHAGQIYVGAVNWALYFGCIALVLTFKSSANLASAYGLAVSIDMLITSIAMMILATLLWKWNIKKALLLFVPFAIVDSVFLTANSLKFLSGGWVPVTIGITMFGVMSTWQWGKSHAKRTFTKHRETTVKEFLQLRKKHPEKVRGNLLVLSEYQPIKDTEVMPALVDIFRKKFHSIPQHLIMLSINQTKRPYISEDERYNIVVFDSALKKGTSSVISVRANFGFNEMPNVESVIKYLADREDLTPNDKLEDWIVYAGREFMVHPAKAHASLLTRLRTSLYSFMVINSAPRYDYFGLGDDKRLTVELVNVRVHETA